MRVKYSFEVPMEWTGEEFKGATSVIPSGAILKSMFLRWSEEGDTSYSFVGTYEVEEEL